MPNAASTANARASSVDGARARGDDVANDAADDGDDDGCLRRGMWISKRNDVTKCWNRRFARVVGDRLEFRKDATSDKASSSVALDDVRGCVASSLNIHGERGKAGCGVYIEVKNVNDGVFLCAETPGEATAFVEAFRDARANGTKRANARAEKPRDARVRALIPTAASPGEVNSGAYIDSPQHSGSTMDTRGRIIDTFGAMEIALQAKDELLAAEAAGRESLESALRSETKLSAELQKRVSSLKERLENREKELKLVRENLQVEKAYSSELREQLDEALVHATEMEDTAAAATMEIERLDRELADARSTRERMEEALMSEGDYLRQREAEEFQRQRQLESQLNEAKNRIEELELKHEGELADVRRRSSHAVAVASATEQELLLSRDRLLSELARMRREGYETVLNTSRDSTYQTGASAPSTPSRVRTVSMPTTPSRLGQVSSSPRRVAFKDSHASRVHLARDSPRTPRSYASHPEPDATPDGTRRALFDRSTRSPGKHLDASRVIDRLDSPGTHGCRVQ